jgi:hypothetical protein
MILIELAIYSCIINPLVHVLVLWVTTLCSLVGHYQHFTWSSACCLYMYFNPQGSHNPENQNMNPHHCHNLKFCIPLQLLLVRYLTILSASCHFEIVLNISLNNVTMGISRRPCNEKIYFCSVVCIGHQVCQMYKRKYYTLHPQTCFLNTKSVMLWK